MASSQTPTNMSKRQPITFVLSGGGSVGAIQVGIFRALYERGVVPDLVMSSPSGALNSASRCLRVPRRRRRGSAADPHAYAPPRQARA